MVDSDGYMTIEELKASFKKNAHIKGEELRTMLKNSKNNRPKFSKEVEVYA